MYNRRRFLSLAASSAAACRRDPAANPEKFRFLVSIYQENPEAEASRLKLAADYLSAELNRPVEILGSAGYGVAIEAFRAHKIEACTIGPFAYVLAAEKALAEVIVMRGTLDGKPANYAGNLAVRADSPLNSIADLIAHSKELTVSFVDPASTSGNLVQRAYLDTQNIDPERDFKRIVYSQSHNISVLTLIAGKADVAAVNDTVFSAMSNAGQLKPGQIRFLWTSPPIPESPVAVRKDLPQDLKIKLRDALVAMRGKAPEAYRNMSAKSYMDRYAKLKFIPATDADFDSLRRMARGVKNANLLN